MDETAMPTWSSLMGFALTIAKIAAGGKKSNPEPAGAREHWGQSAADPRGVFLDEFLAEDDSSLIPFKTAGLTKTPETSGIAAKSLAIFAASWTLFVLISI